jgi:hypothetical protein
MKYVKIAISVAALLRCSFFPPPSFDQKVKVNASLGLINSPRREDVWGSGGMAPPFMKSALNGGEWSASRPCRFTPGKRPRYPLCRRLGGPQTLSERYGEEKNKYVGR